MTRWSEISDVELDRRLAGELRTMADEPRVDRDWPRVELLAAVRAGRARSKAHAIGPRWAPVAGLAAFAGLLLVILAIALLRSPPSMPGGPYDETHSGDFVLSLSAGRPAYAAGEPIDVFAELAYDGPEESVSLSGVVSLVNGFGVRQLDGPLAMGPGWDAPCLRHELRLGEPLRVSYQKSGGYSPGDPDADFYAAWLRDSVFWLPEGRWEITAYSDFFAGPQCGGGARIELQASIVLVVGGPTTTAAPAHSLTRAPATPQLGPTPGPTLQDGLVRPAYWTIAPGERPAAGSTRLEVVVHEMACASGQSPEGRIVGPEIDYRPDSVTITVHVRELPGAQECPGAPGARVIVELDQPLGDRQVIDGGLDVVRVLEHGPELLVLVDASPQVAGLDRVRAHAGPDACLSDATYDREPPDTADYEQMANELGADSGLLDGGRAWLGSDWVVAARVFGAFEAIDGQPKPWYFLARAEGQPWLPPNVPDGALVLADLEPVNISGGRTVWLPAYWGYSSAVAGDDGCPAAPDS